MKHGHVILLNGTSSSGKTTLARALQDKLGDPYMYVSVDDFLNLYPQRFLDPTNREEFEVLAGLVSAVISGLHGAVAALARSGNNLLVDHVLQEPGWLMECIQNWTGLDVLFVGVRCSLDVAEHREKERGDREIGTARYQFQRVHAHAIYDVEVDTSVLDVDRCVKRIIEAVENQPAGTAFQKILAGSRGWASL